MRKRTPLLAVLLFVAVLAAPAAAEPIRIVSGTFTVQGFSFFNRAEFSFIGEDGSTFQGVWPLGMTQVFTACGSACAAGTEISPQAVFTRSAPFSQGEPFAHGSAVLNGQRFADTLFGGDLIFSGPGMRIPPGRTANGRGTAPVSYTVPFTMSGYLSGYDRFGFPEAQPLFTAELEGSGVATITLLGGCGAKLTYRYCGSSREPGQGEVPEPASLLLLASGLVGSFFIRRRRSGSRS